MSRYFILFVSCIAFAILSSGHQCHSHDWGFFGHKKLNELAVFTLPAPLFSFYKKNLSYLIEHSVDPDKRRYSIKGEAECHYIDLDHYYPHTKAPSIMPLTWSQAICQFEIDSLHAHGIVPWQVQKKLAQLTEAFVSKDKKSILQMSAELGHYIGDAHVPLHTTSNYNGQLTNQKGLHGFWESRLPELFYEDYTLPFHQAQRIDRPDQVIWVRIWESHLALDSVFQFEIQAKSMLADQFWYDFQIRGEDAAYQYSEKLSQHYHQLLQGQVERRMKRAIACIGDFWYTAWVNAGQPSLP
ncbi:MAG: S1/P1 Nuclease [Bacteroidetes bacterium]|nr:S1/P1 Nuclease [Bacteroidota bacterium]